MFVVWLPSRYWLPGKLPREIRQKVLAWDLKIAFVETESRNIPWKGIAAGRFLLTIETRLMQWQCSTVQVSISVVDFLLRAQYLRLLILVESSS